MARSLRMELPDVGWTQDRSPKRHPIVFVSHSAALSGAELTLLDIAEHFRDRARVVLFEEGDLQGELRKRKVDCTVFPMPASIARLTRDSSLPAAARSIPEVGLMLRRLAREFADARLIFTKSQKAFVIAGLAGRLSGKRVVWQLCDIVSADHFSFVMRTLAVGLARCMRVPVVANSEATARAFVACGGSPSRVSVIHVGVPSGAYRPRSASEIATTRAALGLGEQPVIGVFSRLAPWKGQDVLVDAMRALPDAEALIVGDALFGEEPFKARLKEMISQAGLTSRVRLLGHRTDVPDLMAACDVVAHVSVAAEPFGRVVVEGMLTRKPVVATAAGGVLEIIDDGADGLLVPPGDSRALASALRRLLDDPALARRIADRGFDKAQDHFRLESMLARLTAFADGQLGAAPAQA